MARTLPFRLGLVLPTLVPLLVSALSAAEVTSIQETQWRTQMKQALRIPDPLPALEPKTHARLEVAPDVVIERVTYGTQFGMRTPAIVYFPKERKGPAPALIVVNGHGGDKYSWYAMYSGILYARAGAIVLTFDPTGEGERNLDRLSGTRDHDHLDPVDASWHAELAKRQAGLIVGDVMQAVSYLLQRPEVDPKRIGAMGYSMGSMITALTGAVDPRLRACVVAGGGGFGIPNPAIPETKAGGSKPSCIQGIPYRGLAFLKDPPAVIYALNAARGATLVVNGELDWDGKPRKNPRQMEATRQRTIEFRGRSDGIFDVSALEPGAIHRPYFVNRDVALWLHHQLQFPNWTEAAILALPTTYIRDWAAKEKVEVDPSYTTEGLESGAHALGAGIPGLTREQLSVFTAQEWQAEKDRMTLNSWMDRTLHSMGITPPPPSAVKRPAIRTSREPGS
jgi:dienelactone hydrolase